MITKNELLSHIKESYAKLGFEPRGNQESICIDVLDAFLNKGIRNVVLNAPTGVGKSILGAVISDTLNTLTPEDNDLSSIISMGQNSLAKQYAESFSSLGKYEFFQIRGAGTYPCAFMTSQPSATSKTADACVKSKLLPQESDRYCSGCEYDSAKKVINVTANLITNYTYFMISALASNHLKPRKLHVFDEAHTLNDNFCTYSEIIVSAELIDYYIKELSDTNGKCDSEIAALVMLKNKVTSKEIGDNNYMQCVTILGQLYLSIAKILGSQSAALRTLDVVKSGKYTKMASKYTSNSAKITDLIDNEYDHVFDNSVPNTFTIKTIFVGKMMEKLLTTYNLFMSATITEDYAFDILSLDKTTTEFIMIPPVFPPENKKLFFIGKAALNFNSLKDPSVIDTLKHQIKTIVDFHKGDKGLIIAPSFYLGSQLVYGLKGCKVFEHKSGVNLSELIESFKEYSGSAVLVSPSIFEGLDFSDDHSRFQIIVKAPYASLGDKRIKHIADNYSHIYREMTLVKILQGIGRSVRTPTDYAVTYMLDPAIEKLYKSGQNIWKDHYTVVEK
jgi:ATP-dependent DNA helicase DinG